MENVNFSKAWEVLAKRKGAGRGENRTAFIACLIYDKSRDACMRSTGDYERFQPHHAAAFAVELVRLATSIKSLAEAECNYELSALQITRQENLRKRFAELATALGFEPRTTGDPRGAVAYLIDPDNRKGDGFGEGWAVYK